MDVLFQKPGGRARSRLRRFGLAGTVWLLLVGAYVGGVAWGDLRGAWGETPPIVPALGACAGTLVAALAIAGLLGPASTHAIFGAVILALWGNAIRLPGPHWVVVGLPLGLWARKIPIRLRFILLAVVYQYAAIGAAVLTDSSLWLSRYIHGFAGLMCCVVAAVAGAVTANTVIAATRRNPTEEHQ